MIIEKALTEFFKISPTPSLLIDIDSPKFTILEVNDGYLEMIQSKREDLVGKGIFEAIPENEKDLKSDGFENLKASLTTVIKSKKSHKMVIEKHDIPDRNTLEFEVKYWNVDNIPLFGNEDKVQMIIHTVVDVTEKVLLKIKTEQAQFTIDKGNELLQQTENISKLGRWEIDRTTNKTYWSDNHYIMLGYEPQEFEITLEKTIELIYPEDREKMMAHFEYTLKECKDYKIEFRFIAKNNSIIDILTRGTFVFDKEGILKKQVGVVQDITDIKAAEAVAKKAIDESNERFKYVTKATFDAIWDWDIATDAIYWGEGFEKIFGHKIAELENNSSSWTKNIHPDDLEKMLESFYKTIKGTATNWRESYRYRKGNGDYSFVINKGIIIRGEDQRAKRIIGAMQDVTKQKQEEQRLKLLESVIINATDAVLITEAEPFDYPGHKIIFVNEAFTTMTGYTAEEVMGKTPRLLQGPKSDKKELKKLGATLRRWESCEVTLLNYKKNGEAFWINIAISPVANEKGRFTHWIAIERDVTKQKLEEERLKILEAVITNTRDAVVIKEANPSSELGRKIVYVNESFTKMTGYSESEIIGKTKKLLHGSDANNDELARFYKDLDEQKPTEITTINHKKNGEKFWVNLSSNPVFNSEGVHTHWVSIERDVTERINQEQKLAEINQKLFETLESIQDGFYTLDADWNISYWNKEAERLSGKSHQYMTGMNIWEVYEGEVSEQIYAKFREAKEKDKPVRLETYSTRLNKWFEINAFPSTMGLTVYFKDITDRKQVESKINKMNRKLEANIKKLAISNLELEQFAYVASHDLQEPLRMVTGFLTQIEKKYEDVLDDKGKQYIHFAVDGAKRMRQIILDLLEFSRIGKNENTIEKINLNEVLNETCLLFRKQMEEKNAELIFKDLPKILNYSAPIKQIFHNLIGNGLKYSDANRPPVITISSQETAVDWKFVVQDNGIGIEAEYFDRIFIIFQRLHHKEQYSGTGIGLAITKKIIENLGGQIWVESEEGVGSAFHFTIPIKQTKKE